MALISTLRHDSIFDARTHDFACTVIGCGAIGSRVFESLVSLGLDRLTAYDFDTVEAHNVANQLYGCDQIGQPKVSALQAWHRGKIGAVSAHSRARFINEAVTADTPPLPSGVVFLAVDSFAARRAIYDTHLARNPAILAVFDFRMAALHGEVLTFDPTVDRDAEHWLSTLGSDDPEHSERSVCGTSITVGPTATLIANLGVIQFITWATNPVALEPTLEIYLRPMMFSAARAHRSIAA